MADPRVDSLVSRITENPPVKSHQFDAFITIPNGTQYDVNTAFSQPVVSFTTGTRSVLTKEYAYYGVKRKIPYKRNYGDLSITFKLDEFGSIQERIENWMDQLINPVSDILTPFKALSGGMVTLQERAFNNKVTSQFGTNFGAPSAGMPRYRFFEAFPVEILPIEFSNETKNSTVNYTVLFAYKDYDFDKI
mgnify:CR=1 FL=1|jgi:hypothetical protein